MSDCRSSRPKKNKGTAFFNHKVLGNMDITIYEDLQLNSIAPHKLY